MTPYIISYDLKGEDPEYQAMYDKIEKITSYCIRVQGSVFIAKSLKTPKEIRNLLKHIVNSNDEILIIEVEKSWATYNLRITKEEFNKIFN